MVAIPAGFSPADYLALERGSAVRHEYRRGLVYAMVGGSDRHNRLTINLLTEINLHLRGGDCQFFSGDVKVSYADSFFYYPDAFVTCDLRDQGDRYTKRYPKLIAEVLSPFTEAFDRTDKFQDYRAFPSLEEYVLIPRAQVMMECHRRRADGTWQQQSYAAGESVVLESIGLEIATATLYEGIRLA